MEDTNSTSNNCPPHEAREMPVTSTVVEGEPVESKQPKEPDLAESSLDNNTAGERNSAESSSRDNITVSAKVEGQEKVEPPSGDAPVEKEVVGVASEEKKRKADDNAIEFSKRHKSDEAHEQASLSSNTGQLEENVSDVTRAQEPKADATDNALVPMPNDREDSHAIGAPIPASQKAVVEPSIESETAQLASKSTAPSVKRKSPRKTFYGSKETSNAKDFLKDKIDLCLVLDKDDCVFLAEKLMIFTLQQLSWLLTSNSDRVEEGLRQKAILELYKTLDQTENGDGSDLVESNEASFDEDRSVGEYSSFEDVAEPSEASIDASQSPPRERSDLDKPSEANVGSNGQSIQVSMADSGVAGDPEAEIAKPETGQQAATDESLLSAQSASVQEKVELWRKAIAEYSLVSPGNMKNRVEDSFFLDGPLSCLIPAYGQNLLKSFGQRTTFQLLSIRKSESALVSQMHGLWRVKCGLPEVPPIALGRFFQMIATRLVEALGSSRVPDPYSRSFIRSDLVLFKGAARDFLIDHKYASAKEFLLRQTKIVSDSLVRWRETKNLPALRGSGKVAMISSWKAHVGQVMNLRRSAGRIITDTDFLELAEKFSDEEEKVMDSKASVQIPSKEGRTSPTTQELETQASESLAPRATFDIDSTTVLSDFFGERVIDFMKSVDVDTPRKLLDVGHAPDSPLVDAVFKVQSAAWKKGNPSKIRARCVEIVKDWQGKIRGRVERQQALDASRKAKKEKIRKAALRKNAEKVPKAPPVKKVKPPSKPKRKATTKTIKKSTKESKPPIFDPFSVLSSTAVAFCKSIGIETAEQLLATKTTDMAKVLVPWRESRNMPALKGQGAIASVSGWKGQVRKAAKDLGFEELSEVKGKITGATDQNKTKKRQAKVVVPLKTAVEEKIRQDMLFGLPSRRVVVRASDGCWYIFVLTVRKCTSRNDDGVFLTYQGSSSVALPPVVPEETSNMPSLPIMEDISSYQQLKPTHGRRVFSSLAQGCGFIDLTSHGIPSQWKKVTVEEVKHKLQDFLGLEQTSTPKPTRECSSNVLSVIGSDGRVKYLLPIIGQMEIGQTMELRYSEDGGMRWPTSCGTGDCQLMKWFRHALPQLDKSEVLQVLKLLSDAAPQINRLLGEGSSGGIKEDACSHEKTLVSALRLRWIVWILQDHLDGDDDGPHRDLRCFLSRSLLEKLPTYPLAESSVAALRNELTKQLLGVVDGDVPSDEDMKLTWCPLSSRFCKRGISLLADHLLRVGPQEFSDETIVTGLDNATSEVLAAISSGDTLVSDLQLTFPLTAKPIIPSLPSKVVYDSGVKLGYSDAMTLCGEKGHPMLESTQVRVVAVTEDSGLTSWRNVSSFDRSTDNIDVQWYIRFQIAPICHMLLEAARSWLGREKSISERLQSVVDSQGQSSGTSQAADMLQLNYLRATQDGPFPVPHAFVEQLPLSYECQPHSFQLFLGLIWPKMKRRGWTIVAGERESDITFFAPESRQTDRYAALSHEIIQRRNRVSIAARSTGLQIVPRLSKRMLGKIEDEEGSTTKPLLSVAGIFDRFIVAKLSDEDESSKAYAGKLVDIVSFLSESFDEMAPTLFANSPSLSAKDEKPSKVLGIYALVRYLLIVPSILSQMELPVEQMESTRGTIKELLGFVSENASEFLGVQLSREVYKTDDSSKPFLHPLLDKAQAKSQSNEAMANAGVDIDNPREVVLPEEWPLLTDFVRVIMTQMSFSKSLGEGTNRKGRTIPAATDGLVCRHCLAASGDGIFFPTVFDSFQTLPNVVEKHLLRCFKVPDEIKQEISESRTRHRQQLKNSPRGQQTQYFRNLWNRLKSQGGTGGVYVSLKKEEAPLPAPSEAPLTRVEVPSTPTDADSFQSHLEILQVLQTDPRHQVDVELMEAVARYYNVLEYGGRIYQTNVVPSHFSSEWLLSKVAPPARRKRKAQAG